MKLNATATYYAYSHSFVSMKIVHYGRMYNNGAIYIYITEQFRDTHEH